MAGLKLLVRGLVWATVLASTASKAATLTVDQAGDADYDEIQTAIDAAVNGDTVLVKPGLYLTCAPLSFHGKAVTVKAAEGPARTTIRRCEPPTAEEDAVVIVFRDGETESSLLDGFTVAGYVENLQTLLTPGFRATVGGGVLCAGNVRPTLRNCVIAGVSAEYGGGVACVEGASPTISRCSVSWNLAFGGGGVYVEDGSPLFEDCTIEGNVAEFPDAGGGGVLCVNSGIPRFVRCAISGNAAGCGSAVHVDDASPIFENCTIFGHSIFALELACGACAEPMFINCTISENEWDGFACHGFNPALFLNCILSSNWQQAWNPWSETTPNLSDADPLFVSEGVVDFTRWGVVELAGTEIRVPSYVVEEPDFHIRADSPAIDAGTSARAPDTDIEGNKRPRCGGVDLGAYEFSSCDALPPRLLRGDCSDDGEVDISDGVCILNWLFLGGAAPSCAAVTNINGDDKTDVADPSYLFNFLFLGGPPPAAPFPDCGTSDLPADEALGCAESPQNCP